MTLGMGIMNPMREETETLNVKRPMREDESG